MLILCLLITYPPSQKAAGICPWMNAHDGPSEAWRAKEGASADSAEEMKDATSDARGGFIQIALNCP